VRALGDKRRRWRQVPLKELIRSKDHTAGRFYFASMLDKDP
jgi:hypothetical protein